MLMNLLQRLIPNYGNWGGPGWSSGRYEDDPDETDWTVPPRDSLDRLFMEHDRAYQNSIKNLPEDQWEEVWDKADCKLAREAKALPSSPTKWPDPPVTASWLYAYLYRKIVIFVFCLRGKL